MAEASGQMETDIDAPLKIERFRKRPIVVDTVVWDGSSHTANRFIGERYGMDWRYTGEPEGAAIEIWNTREKCWVRCPVGHRIVKGVVGEFYPIDPVVLEQTYDRET